MKAAVNPLKFRFLAGLALATFGISAGAASLSDLNVANFKAASPVLRPQTVRTTASATRREMLKNNGFIVPNIVNSTPTVNMQQPVVARPTVKMPVAAAPKVSPAPVDNNPITFPPFGDDASLGGTPLTGRIPTPRARPSNEQIAEADDKLQAGLTGKNICPYADGRCYKGQHAGGLKAQAEEIKKASEAHATESTADKSLMNRLAIEAVTQAVKGRSVARFCGGGFRSGNRSKCACAAGVKDALLASGVCASRPAGDAVNLAGLPRGTTDQLSRTGPVAGRSLASTCPVLHQTHGRDRSYRGSLNAAENAPAGSVIVYSTSRHGYGHIEIKVKVTADNYSALSKKLNVKMGQYLYCSDFCRTGPTFSHGTNRVEGIYSL